MSLEALDTLADHFIDHAAMGISPVSVLNGLYVQLTPASGSQTVTNFGTNPLIVTSSLAGGVTYFRGFKVDQVALELRANGAGSSTPGAPSTPGEGSFYLYAHQVVTGTGNTVLYLKRDNGDVIRLDSKTHIRQAATPVTDGTYLLWTNTTTNPHVLNALLNDSGGTPGWVPFATG